MKKIICLIGPDKRLPGGIATVIKQIDESYLKKKYNLKIISTYSNKKNQFIIGIKDYIKLLFTDKPRIVHIHMASKGSFFRKYIFICLTPKNINIILHIHGGGFIYFYQSSNLIIKKMIQKTLKKSDNIIAVSEIFRTNIMKTFNLSDDKVKKIYNGIEISGNYNDVFVKKNQVLYMGKLTESKGVYDLLKIIPLLHEENPKTKFVISGNGELDKVKNIIKENNMNEYVNITGWIEGEEKENILKESSILVVPSYFESFGIVILEAMKYGMAIVATNVGGIPDIVKQNENGILVNAGDIKELKKSVSYYLNNIEIKEKVCNTNRYAYLNFDINKTLKDFDELYNSMT